MASPEGIPGPPYPPDTQALGETPSVIPDVPINAIFLLLFIVGGAAHMTILQINQRRHNKKFAINGMIFGFCVTRVCATTLRIAWACNPTSVRLGLASTIFFYAGVVLLFIADLFFTQRIVRAQHPHVGWSKLFSMALPILIALIVATIICLIVAIVLLFYSLDQHIRESVRIIQIYGATFYAIVSFIPIPVLLISTFARGHDSKRVRKAVDKFGVGSMRAKVAITLISAILLTLGASYRAGTTWLPPVPLFTDTRPPQPAPAPWYFSKASFYAFDFAIEAFIVYFWLIVRIDKRFIVPNGASGPYSYAGGFIFAGESGNEKKGLSHHESLRHLTGSQPESLSMSRTSWGGSRRSTVRGSHVSWGGVSRDDIHATLGEDGVISPYPGIMYDTDIDAEEEIVSAEPYIDGVDQEMGWDSRNGKWALRPLSTSHLRHSSSQVLQR